MILIIVASVILAMFILYHIYKPFAETDDEIYLVGYKEEWFGEGPPPKEDNFEEDSSIRPFKIDVKEEVLCDLQLRLENARIPNSYAKADFKYGFHSQYLNEVKDYWLKEYKWRKHEEYLNQFPQFKTKIEGIDIHFVHVKPKMPIGVGVKVLPLLMLHGWPGAFAEFYKIIPILTKSRHNVVFEVICPSLPGFGFSESPHHKGLHARAAARIFVTLMQRIGHSKFYLQGGDWGSNIAVLIAKYYSSNVIGLHVNFFYQEVDLRYVVRYILLSFFPSWTQPHVYSSVYPFKKRLLGLLEESGYFHIQSTKPDTIGIALDDSPIGLAAYILEKFSSGTNLSYIDLPDGGLTRKFSLDELLTIVMIYWVNQKSKSSIRFYKENMIDKNSGNYSKIPIQVPFGIIQSPHEIPSPTFFIPKETLKHMIHYTEPPRGGHFLAMEDPELLADDVFAFVEKVEHMYDFQE